MRITPEERAVVEERERQRVKGERLLALIIVVALVGGLIYFINSNNQDKQNHTDDKIEVGSEAYLYQNTPDSLVGIDEQSLSDLEESLAAKDKTGFADLIQSGRVLVLPAKTKVLILRTGLAVKVRVLEGEYMDRVVWTDSGWIVRHKN